MFCGKCGKYIAPEDLFCKNCGTRANSDLERNVFSSAEVKQKISVKKVIIICILVVAALLLGGFFILRNRYSPLEGVFLPLEAQFNNGKVYLYYEFKADAENNKQGTYTDYLGDVELINGIWEIKNNTYWLYGKPAFSNTTYDSDSRFEWRGEYLVSIDDSYPDKIPLKEKFFNYTLVGENRTFTFSSDGTLTIEEDGKNQEATYEIVGNVLCYTLVGKTYTNTWLICNDGIYPRAYYKAE